MWPYFCLQRQLRPLEVDAPGGPGGCLCGRDHILGGRSLCAPVRGKGKSVPPVRRCLVRPSRVRCGAALASSALNSPECAPSLFPLPLRCSESHLLRITAPGLHASLLTPPPPLSNHLTASRVTLESPIGFCLALVSSSRPDNARKPERAVG